MFSLEIRLLCSGVDLVEVAPSYDNGTDLLAHLPVC